MNQYGVSSSEEENVQIARKPDIGALFTDDVAMQRAMNRGVREALRRHKLLGESIVVWEDGEIVEVPPEEIEIPEDDANQP
jgi:hypothetical protein